MKTILKKEYSKDEPVVLGVVALERDPSEEPSKSTRSIRDEFCLGVEEA